jgi:hypothetical protein
MTDISSAVTLLIRFGWVLLSVRLRSRVGGSKPQAWVRKHRSLLSLSWASRSWRHVIALRNFQLHPRT